jgi:hypothetical protein
MSLQWINLNISNIYKYLYFLTIIVFVAWIYENQDGSVLQLAS